MRRVLLAAAIAACALAAPAAQTKFTSRVESVRLDALVTRNGQPLLGLTADDFEIRDNGAVQHVTLLGAGSRPLDVILALDMSSSLTRERLAALREAGDALLNGLKPGDRAALATFSHAVQRRQALAADVEAVRRTLYDAEPSGATSLVDAMFAAISMAEPGDRRTLLIVFSDGIDTASWLQPTAVVRAAQRTDTVVYAVSTVGAGQAAALLRDVTAATGGKVLAADSTTLASAFVRILDEFRQRYVLSYTLGGTPAPGWHRIQVRVRSRGAEVKARPGYEVR